MNRRSLLVAAGAVGLTTAVGGAAAALAADDPEAGRTNGRRFRLQFEGLEETRRDRAYPMPAYSLLDHLTQLRDRTNRMGSPWRPDAVRLIAVALDPAQPTGANGTQPVPWPAGVPEPRLHKDEFVAQLDLRGPQARALIHAVPHPDPAQWPVFRTSDGRRMQVNWRYLNPDE